MSRTASALRADSRTILFCSPRQWMAALVAGLAVGALAWPWYQQVSYWVGAVLLLMVITACHMVFSSRLIVPFPHIAILIAGLQYTVAAWLSFYFPSAGLNYDIGLPSPEYLAPAATVTYDIGLQLPRYLAFGSGITIAVVFGWALAIYGASGRPCPALSPSPKLLAELDVLFWFGLLCGLVARFVPSQGLGFLLLLCANLRYVGSLGRMLVNGPGWQWRVALTLVVEVLLATEEGMFHALLLWSVSAFAVYLYRFRPRPSVVSACICLGLLLLPALHESKWRLRQETWGGDATESPDERPDSSARPVKITFDWLWYLAEGLYEAATLSMDREFLADTIVRYNQGWIVNRVMNRVPSQEPYAEGETLVTAAKAALLPRLVAPQKYVAGGKLHMARFVGMEMEGTSMNLGYGGELYANFGSYGAVAGCFIYAALLGLAFRWVARRALRSPLWWVFLPYVGSIAFKAEDGVAEVLNWMVKATLVAAAVYLLSPALRAALSAAPDALEKRTPSPKPKPGPSRRLGARAQRPQAIAQRRATSARPLTTGPLTTGPLTTRLLTTHRRNTQAASLVADTLKAAETLAATKLT